MNRYYSALYSAIYPRLPTFAQNAACTTGGWMRFRAVKSEVGRNAR